MLLREAALARAGEPFTVTRRPDIDRILLSPSDVADLVWPWFRGCEQETAYVLCLNTKHRYLCHQLISLGTADTSIIHPRDVYRLAIRENSAAVILAHCHPSGVVKPSAEDLAITRRLKAAGEIIGIELLDHVIVTTADAKLWYSLRDRGDL